MIAHSGLHWILMVIPLKVKNGMIVFFFYYGNALSEVISIVTSVYIIERVLRSIKKHIIFTSLRSSATI